MLALIKSDPRQALARAVRFSEYARLPEAMRAHVERPFSARAELLAQPVCTSGSGGGVSYDLIVDGESYAASVFGRRTALGTKEGTPLQGITLGGRAAVREEVFQSVATEDAVAFPEAAGAPGHCFASGEPLGSDAVTALAGGERFHFASAAVLTAFDARLGAFDQRLGPYTGSQVLFPMADAAGAVGEAFDWPAAEAGVDLQASLWTETVKNL